MQNRIVTPGQIIKVKIFFVEGGTLNYNSDGLIEYQIYS